VNQVFTSPNTKEFLMIDDENSPPLILVVEEVQEIRDGIEELLKTDGYRVASARGEQDAIERAQPARPDLILISLTGSSPEVMVIARRIRDQAGIDEEVPVVAFCSADIGEGDEVPIGQNVHLTRPDNFNQLRSLLARLLRDTPITAGH
jgi:CheY-like chemotaxis protein